jgi:putative acetyltransferase
MPMYTIAIPTQSDYPELIGLWESSVRATHYFLGDEEIEYFKRKILEGYFDFVDLYTAKAADEKIVGFLGLNSEKIEMLYVQPDHMGKGIGKFLLLHAIQAKGVSKVDVNEKNQQAVGFYQKMGFKINKRNPFDAEGKPHAILEMELAQVPPSTRNP